MKTDEYIDKFDVMGGFYHVVSKALLSDHDDARLVQFRAEFTKLLSSIDEKSKFEADILLIHFVIKEYELYQTLKLTDGVYYDFWQQLMLTAINKNSPSYPSVAQHYITLLKGSTALQSLHGLKGSSAVDERELRLQKKEFFLYNLEDIKDFLLVRAKSCVTVQGESSVISLTRVLLSAEKIKLYNAGLLMRSEILAMGQFQRDFIDGNRIYFKFPGDSTYYKLASAQAGMTKFVANARDEKSYKPDEFLERLLGMLLMQRPMGSESTFCVYDFFHDINEVMTAGGSGYIAYCSNVHNIIVEFKSPIHAIITMGESLRAFEMKPVHSQGQRHLYSDSKRPLATIKYILDIDYNDDVHINYKSTLSDSTPDHRLVRQVKQYQPQKASGFTWFAGLFSDRQATGVSGTEESRHSTKRV